MTLDQAIQNTLRASGGDIEAIAYLAENDRDNLILEYQANYGWTYPDCEEYLKNISMAYELLVKEGS